MYVLSVTRKERQPEQCMHTMNTVGISIQIRGMTRVMEWSYVSDAIKGFIGNTDIKR